jgi:hypothetical protein
MRSVVARAVPYRLDRHGGQCAKLVDHAAQDRRAGGCDGLPLHVRRHGGDAAQQLEGRGRRKRQPAVGRLHRALAEGYRAGRDARDTESRECDGRARDVHDGVHRTHLVEVDLLECYAVDAGLGAAQRLEDREGALAHLGVQARTGDQARDRDVAAPVGGCPAVGRASRLAARSARYAHVEVTGRQRAAPHAAHHQGVVEREAREVGFFPRCRRNSPGAGCAHRAADDAVRAGRPEPPIPARCGRAAGGRADF